MHSIVHLYQSTEHKEIFTMGAHMDLIAIFEVHGIGYQWYASYNHTPQMTAIPTMPEKRASEENIYENGMTALISIG